MKFESHVLAYLLIIEALVSFSLQLNDKALTRR